MIDTEALRKKVYDLAIQGKLTKRDPHDEDAAALYSHIQEEKTVLIKKGIIKKEKSLPEIEAEEKAFELPKNWRWVRLGEICLQITDGTHKTPKYQNEGVPFLSVKNISSGSFDLSEIKYISEEEHNDLIKRCKPERNDVLVCRIGTLGKAKTIDIDLEFSIFVSLGLIKTTGKVVSDYIALVINSGYGDAWINDNKAGGAMHTYKINLNSLALLPIPLAPLCEIEEILNKITKVNSLISNVRELQGLYDRDLSVLKSKIIDAGIRGKLTEQLPEDGDAETLYLQIQEEKAKLIKEGKIKKEKALPEIEADEVPFEIPKNWKWVRIGNVTYNHGQKTPQNRFCYIDVGTLDNNNHKLNDRENIIEANDAPSRAKKVVEIGDILYSTVRPYLHNICLVDRDFSYEPIASTAFAVMHTFENCLLNRYLFFWLLSEWFDKYANGDSSKGTLYPAIGEKDFFKGLVPLPPFMEQTRIVNIIDETLKHI